MTAVATKNSAGGFRWAWEAFMDAYAGHRAQPLAAFRAWQRAWEVTFWAGDFSEFGFVYLPDVELRNHLGLLGTADVHRGLEGFEGWRDETLDVSGSGVWVLESRRVARVDLYRGRRATLTALWATRGSPRPSAALRRAPGKLLPGGKLKLRVGVPEVGLDRLRGDEERLRFAP
jgi:hypothetical protein